MGGFFGCIADKECVNDLFYGTDYNSHLGTKRAGLVTFDPERGFNRSIHSLERDYFRSRFEDELDSFHGYCICSRDFMTKFKVFKNTLIDIY